MSLFKKVARAFVVIEDEESTGGSGPRPASAGAGMDDLGADAAELLAQLNSSTSPSRTQAEPLRPVSSAGGAGAVIKGAVSGARQGALPTNVVQTPAQAPVTATHGAGAAPEARPALFSMTASDVFLSAGIADTPSSAERMLKMLAGLAMFPREQQRYMIQAMDAADPSWTELSVQSDAQARVQALQQHLQHVSQEKTDKQKALADQMGATQTKGNEILSEIDKQIAELQKMREEALKETTLELDRLTLEGRQLEEQARAASAGISQVIGSLSNLITFLGGQLPTPEAAPQPAQTSSRPPHTTPRRG